MSSDAIEAAFVYRIPHFSPMIIEGPEYLPQVRETLRMVLEDDVWNAAARGEQTEALPPLRASVPLSALKRSGIAMPGARKFDERRLSDALWNVIRGLSTLGIFLESTDHLTDRELYDVLREKYLKTKAILAPAVAGFSYTLMLLGEGEKVADRDAKLPRPMPAKSRVLPLSS